MNPYQSFAYRTLGPHLGAFDAPTRAFARLLPRAGDPVRADVHVATLVLSAGLGLGIGTLLALPLLFSNAPFGMKLFLVFLPVTFALFATLPFILGPISRAQDRAKRIDAHLPAALHYVATMASAGTAPERIFDGLARQTVYGEVAREASYIVRDLRLLGLDLRAAFRAAMERTPSTRMQGLLQGAVTALDAGDDLANYFLVKSRQFEQDDRENEKKFLEGLGVLAESYVTLVVAAPVFLLVLLSVLIVLGSGPVGILDLGYFLVLVFIPLVQVLFYAVLKTMSPEA